MRIWEEDERSEIACGKTGEDAGCTGGVTESCCSPLEVSYGGGARSSEAAEVDLVLRAFVANLSLPWSL